MVNGPTGHRFFLKNFIKCLKEPPFPNSLNRRESQNHKGWKRPLRSSKSNHQSLNIMPAKSFPSVPLLHLDISRDSNSTSSVSGLFQYCDHSFRENIFLMLKHCKNEPVPHPAAQHNHNAASEPTLAHQDPFCQFIFACSRSVLFANLLQHTFS